MKVWFNWFIVVLGVTVLLYLAKNNASVVHAGKGDPPRKQGRRLPPRMTGKTSHPERNEIHLGQTKQVEETVVFEYEDGVKIRQTSGKIHHGNHDLREKAKRLIDTMNAENLDRDRGNLLQDDDMRIDNQGQFPRQPLPGGTTSNYDNLQVQTGKLTLGMVSYEHGRGYKYCDRIKVAFKMSVDKQQNTFVDSS